MENNFLFLFLASGVVNDEGFWLIGMKNSEFKILDDKTLLECHRRELIGHESAKDILNAINLNLENLINSVKLRLRSDVPLGCFLSGGVDSSIIAAISNNILKANITCFHSQSIDKNNDELKYAIEMCNHSKSKLNLIKPSSLKAIENLLLII